MNIDKILKKIRRLITASLIVRDFPDSIIYVDSEGYITEANKTACECFNINDLNFLKITEFIENGMGKAKESVKFKRPVLALAKVNNTDFYIEINASKIKNGYCLAIRDVTKLTDERLTEKKVERLNEEKNAMIVNIENEIKSPLTSIYNFSKNLLQESPTEMQKKYINIINTNAVDLADYLDNFLTFTYAESSLYKPELQRFDIVSQIKDIIKLQEQKVKDKNLEILFDYESLLKHSAYTDIKAFKIYIKNILDISLDMTPSGGIAIRITEPDEATAFNYGFSELKRYLQITIKDTGSGIDPEQLKHICNPYYWSDKGKNNFIKSLKLGTASILIKRAYGYFDISSELMQGTLFSIIIPVEEEKI